MFRSFLPIVAFAALTACGDGNPFSAGAGGGAGEDSEIPADVAGSFTSFSYNVADGTLTLTGLLRDEDVTTQSYIRKPALDQGVYSAFTAQDDPLDEHTTVYVRELGNVAGAVASTGGQFTYYSGGVNYKRVGGYDPVVTNDNNDTGLATYTGDYVGLSNLYGPDTDRLPVPGNPNPGNIIPGQSSVVTGRVFINVGFASNNVAGTVVDRVITSRNFGTVSLPVLTLAPTDLQEDGTFAGDVERAGSRQEVGEYAGIIGGPDSNALAGGLHVEEHFDTALTVAGEEEYGVFVLGRCGGTLEDSSTECDIVDPE